MDEQPAPLPPPLPITEPPVMEVPVSESSTAAAPRRRSGLILAAVAIVVAALGAGAFFLFRAGTPEFSLKEASTSGRDPMGLSFRSTSSVMGQDITASAQSTPDGRLLQMTMDLGATMAVLGITEPIQAIVNMEDRVLYMGSGFFTALGAPVETPWIRIDRDAAEAAGQDTEFFDQIQIDDPTDTTALFATATDVITVGDEEIDAEKVRHYRVSVPFAEVVKSNPSLGDMLDQFDADMPEVIEYDVWVTKDNRIRRLAYDTDLGDTSMSTTIDFERLTEPIAISEPTAEEFTDALDLG